MKEKFVWHGGMRLKLKRADKESAKRSATKTEQNFESRRSRWSALLDRSAAAVFKETSLPRGARARSLSESLIRSLWKNFEAISARCCLQFKPPSSTPISVTLFKSPLPPTTNAWQLKAMGVIGSFFFLTWSLIKIRWKDASYRCGRFRPKGDS